MKFKELLEVLHPYTDINIWIEHDDTMTLFETSKHGLLKGNHQNYYTDHKDWHVVHAYPDHDDYDGNHLVVRLEEPTSVHNCFFESIVGDGIRDYCPECGKSIFKW
ncbi:hypothetical protein H1N69_gp13 [Lactococcus phage phiQ1]|uniref:Uncharacterized protein n=1 Tax=Lactococcus phage phiQ1 TaxID=2488571 RepID=A0A455VPM2_9CAUD|nr:hypothetical protein H1N69_gp13 [Lactococcus phage phiQ1]BBI90377.1 putative uncharacterized protein [Lactococcus phage phiQ1]